MNSKLKKNILLYISEIEKQNKYPNNLANKYLNHYEKSNNKTVLCKTEYIINNHPGMKNILTSGLIPSIVENICDYKVNLYKEKINYIYSNTGIYKPHQDITAYPDSKNHITCMINLCDTNLLNGYIEFSPTSDNKILNHNNGIISNQDDLNWIDCPTQFGDIVLFNSYIPHRSGINKLDTPRRALYITYNDALEGDLREDYYKHKFQNMDQNKISLIEHYKGSIIKNKSDEINTDYKQLNTLRIQREKEKKKIINEIINLYIRDGNKKYDESITNIEHALQTTQIAKNNGEIEEFQLSCFLQDIGHLLLDQHNTNKSFLQKNLKHETVAYKYLKTHFSNRIILPVMYLVLAKRYLCTVDEEYYHTLSDASKKSFLLQHGHLDNLSLKLMNNILNTNIHFKNAIRLRKYEDLSKKEPVDINIDLNYISDLLRKFII
jgi:predicted HD phosphohydrolase